ncbi:MAG: ATPase, partial [Methanosarcinales archaeon]|nr:ATPase [Methanosarcinales archaeon]
MERISLTISKAKPNDTGRGVARLDPSTLLALSLSPGDMVQIEGKRTTIAKVWRADRQDWGQDLIRIDGYVRQNANASIGDRVMVSKPIIKEADKVILAPTEKMSQFKVVGQIAADVKRQLIGIPVIEGDIVPLEMSHSMSSMSGGAISGGFTPFRAVETSPGGAVRISNRTIIEFISKPVSGFEDVMASGITYEDIGGLHKEVARVREMIEMPLKHPELFSRLGIQPPKGVLMHG